MSEIYKAAKAVEDKIIENRRHLHQHPEVGFDIPKTAEYVKQQLRSMGIEPKDCGVVTPEVREKFGAAGFPNVGKSTGITATIGSGSPCILLRADMDALPMEENTDLPFKATGSMAHTCGHDAHTAMLLGAARILKEKESELKGTVKLMFQPGEEMGYGAKTMVDDGLLEDPKVDAAMALHIMSDQEAGTFEYMKGIMSASMDTWMVTIKGKGGHSSMPHKTVDPNMIVTQLYTALNLLPTREANPQETVALTVGKIAGGSAPNIIPDTAGLQVGMRTYDKPTRDHMAKRIPELMDHYIKAWRGEYEAMHFHTPSTFVDADLTEEMLPYVKEIAGVDKVILRDKPMPGSEDFGYVSEKVPGMFMFLGAGDEGSYGLHNPNMVLDESVFVLGSGALANAAMKWLENQ